MCGIFGFFLNRKLNDLDITKGKKQTEYLTHRGPDGKGFSYIKDKGLFLGHTRLSILDLSSKANQPMKKHNMIISFNGEIYNFLEIKNFLISKGYSFFSKSDTEVLLSAFHYWGVDAVKKLDGMFSIALYMNRKIFLISDYFLEKPLFYYSNDEGVFFSSEPKCITNILGLKKKNLNPINFVALGFIQDGKTGFNNIKSLSQATIIEFDKNKNKKIKKYWRFPIKKFSEKRKIDSQFLDEFTDLLILSIKRRLRSDVNLGLFLSSGVDSKLIATLMKFELKKNIDTFTFSFPGSYDESRDVRSFCNYLNINNRNFYSKKNRDFDEKLLLNIFSYPNDNTTSISINTMCKSIKKKYKVIISGVGGDELTIGYNKYHFIKKFSYLYNNPNFSNALVNLINLFGINSKKTKLLNYYFRGSKSWKLTALKNGNSLEFNKDLFDSISFNNLRDNSGCFLTDILNFDLEQTLPFSYLSAIDRGSMREGVEIRTPFLNKVLFEKISELDISKLIMNKKVLCKKILSRYLPEKLINNKKRGFVQPVYTSKTKNNKFKKLSNFSYKLEGEDYNSMKVISRINLINSFYS